MLSLTRAVLLATLLVHALPAAAGSPEPMGTTADDALWEMRLAGFTRYGAAYPAAGESQLNVVPLPFPIYRGRILRVGDNTEKPIRTRIFRRDRIKLDIDFGLNFSVDSDDIDERAGMPDLDFMLEVGPELELQVAERYFGGDVFVAGQIRGALSFDGLDPEWRGSVISAELKHKRQLWTPRTELLTRITPEWASNDYMDYFYGVAQEFATAERPAYRARSGYLGTTVSWVLGHSFSRRFEVRTGLKLALHSGASNEDSPLFVDDTTTSGYVAFLWKFWESDRRANRQR